MTLATKEVTLKMEKKLTSSTAHCKLAMLKKKSSKYCGRVLQKSSHDNDDTHYIQSPAQEYSNLSLQILFSIAKQVLTLTYNRKKK
jgi:hypothetical protein